MEHKKKIILAYNTAINYEYLRNSTDGQVLDCLSSETNQFGRLLLALVQYLQQYSKYFDPIDFVMTYEGSFRFPNGTSRGLLKKMNYSEIDVGTVPLYMDNIYRHREDYSYPYRLEDYTFITGKPSYKPHIFGIFHTISLTVWLTVILVSIVMPVVYYAMMKKKYTFNTISFHVFAILMRQNFMITPSSVEEKLLVYAWVLGTMILSLSYNCIFLSFLSIPPLTKIEHLSDLVSAVETGDYHCISHIHTGIPNLWKNSEHEPLQIIGRDIIQNKLSYEDPLRNFYRESQKQNLALIMNTKFLDLLGGKFFISGDRFHESMYAMIIRKGFCCKELIDSFVHKMMASGLYIKYTRDSMFVHSMQYNSEFPDHEITNRKLTLTDVAPAFIFLLNGYFVSILVLIVELWLNRKNKNSIKLNQRKRKKVYDENPV